MSADIEQLKSEALVAMNEFLEADRRLDRAYCAYEIAHGEYNIAQSEFHTKQAAYRQAQRALEKHGCKLVPAP